MRYMRGMRYMRYMRGMRKRMRAMPLYWYRAARYARRHLDARPSGPHAAAVHSTAAPRSAAACNGCSWQPERERASGAGKVGCIKRKNSGPRRDQLFGEA